MSAFGGFFTRFKVNTDSQVFGGAGNAQMGAGIEKAVAGFAGRNINVHLGVNSTGRVGLGIQGSAGRQGFQSFLEKREYPTILRILGL
jgi:hypothetical protein